MARSRDKKATVKSLQRDLKSYAREDKQDHARLYAAVSGVKKDVDGVRQQVADMSSDLGNACGQLTVISGILQEQRVVRETKIKTALEDKLDAHKFHRKLILKVATVAVAVGGGVVHLLHVLL